MKDIGQKLAHYSSQGVSILLHPLFMVVYVSLILYRLNPVQFYAGGDLERDLFFIGLISLTIIFPLVAIFMLKAVNLISSIQMKDKKERVGPMIATLLFYAWLYINIRQKFDDLLALQAFLLGTLIALALAFFLNNFTKISLHSIGIAGLLMGLFLIRLNTPYTLMPLGQYLVHLDFLLMLAVVAVGTVGSARLYLGAHDSEQVFGGYLVGAFAQVLAFGILF